MDSKQGILAAIREHSLPAVELPELADDFGIRYDDPHAQFVLLVEAVGGTVHRAADAEEANRIVRGLHAFQAAESRYSNVPGVGDSTLDIEACERPHELRGLGLAVLHGAFAVAENGAVWVSDAGIKHRAVAFLAEHLVLVVPANEIVNNLHEAYARPELQAGAFGEPGYGVFISGPSKTADIEQSLVIGAQGPRSLNVILVG